MTSIDPSTARESNDPANFSQLYRHTIPIFDCDRTPPIQIGNGVFIGVDEHCLVSTAAHVLEEGVRKIGFGCLRSGGLEVFGDQNMNILKANAQSGSGDAQRAVYKDGLDFALLEPCGEALETLRSRYDLYDLRQSSNCVSSPEWGIISGWPARKNAYNPRTRLFDLSTCYHIQCPLADAKKVHEAGWTTDIYIGLSADKAKDFVSEASGARIHLPNLEGVSGAGFWTRSADGSASTWCLAGVIVEDDKPRRMLKVIKIEYLWAPLFRGWGLKR